MLGKGLVIVGGAVFAVFIFFYSLNSQRAENAARDLGVYQGVRAGDWTTSAEWQIAIAMIGLVVAVAGVVVDRRQS